MVPPVSDDEGHNSREPSNNGINPPQEVVQHNIILSKSNVNYPNRSISSTSSPPNSWLKTLQLIACGNRSHSSDGTPLYISTTIVAITPTYKRLTQKSDLVALCHTVMHVPNFLWIVVEDSKTKSSVVEHVLHNCKVNSIHLNVVTSRESKRAGQRGVEQRNAGLEWARKYCKEKCENKCNGVIYFMDDDNKYDLRLFEQVHHYVSSV